MADNTPPITTSNIPVGWNRVDRFQVRLSAIDYADTIVDTPSGVNSTVWAVDGGDSGTNINTGSISPFITEFPVEGQGSFTIRYHSIDNNGNIEIEKVKTLLLDGIAPVSSISVVSPDGTYNWYKTNPSISLTAIDTMSGVDRILYRWDSGSWSDYTIPFQIPAIGSHILEYYAVDVAGNAETAHTQTFSLDDIAPVTEDDAPEGVQKTATTVHFFYSDDASGVVKTYYTTDSSVPTTNSSSGSEVTLRTSGTYIIKYFSVDYAGNQEAVKTSSVELYVDTEAPAVNISESFDINGYHGWWRSTPTIALSASDPSGIAAIKYKLHLTDVTTTAKYTGTVNLTSGANLSSVWLVKIGIDGADPVEIDIRGSIPAATTISEIITTINSDIGATVAIETGADGNTGTGYITIISPTAGTSTAQVKFLQPSGTDATTVVFGLTGAYPHTYDETVYYRTYASPFILTTDGKWTLETYAIDGEGNEGVPISKQYQLDSTQPITEVEASYPPDGTNGWYKTLPEITLSATDVGGSGVWRTFWQWDNGPMYQYTIGDIITFPSEGIHDLKYYSIDIAGNIENIKTTPFYYDISTPVTIDDTLKHQGIIFTAYAEGYNFVENEHPTITAINEIQLDNSGVVSVTEILNFSKGTPSNPLKYRALNIHGKLTPPPINANNYAEIYPYSENEIADVINTTTIQVDYNSIKEVVRVWNRSTSTLCSVQSISGYQLILVESVSLTDVIEVDYSYDGAPLSPTDDVTVDYYYDQSSEDEGVFNTLDYTFIVPFNPPKIHDHNVTIILTPSDIYSGVYKTYYTTDGTTPTTASSEGTEIELVQNGTYTIKYFSVDMAGNAESVKTAAYQIIIDKDIPVLNFYFDRLPDHTEIISPFKEWFNKDFSFISDIYTDNVTQRIYRELALVVNAFAVVTGKNDVIDWSDGSGIQSAIIPSIRVDGTNNKIDFVEGANVYVATLNSGDYTPDTFITEVQSQLNTVSSGYSVYFNDLNTTKNRYAIKKTSGTFSLLWNSGINQASSAYNLLGFYKKDTGDAISHSSEKQTDTRIVYNANDLSSTIGSILGINYTVDFGSTESAKFTIANGTESFDLLWTSSARTIGYLLGFDASINKTGLWSYSSDWLRLKSDVGSINDQFLKTFGLIETYAHQEFTLKRIESGTSGFYDEILVDGIYTTEAIFANYHFYTGMQKADFAIDSTTLTTSTVLRNNLKTFVGLFPTARYVGTIDIPTSIDLSQHYLIKLDIDQSGTPVNPIDLRGINPSGTTIQEIIDKINLAVGQTVAYRTDIDGDFQPVTGTYISLYSNETETLSEITFLEPSFNDATYYIFGIKKFPYVTSRGPQYKIVFPPYVGQFFSQDGTHSIFGKGFDNNSIATTGIPVKESNIQKIDFNLDRVAPVTTDDIPVPMLPPIWEKEIIVTFTGIDVSSGVYRTHFTVDGSTPSTSSPYIQNQTDFPDGKLHLNTSGIYKVKYFSVDNAGNQETVKESEYAYVDSSKPVTTLITAPPNPDGQNGWFRTNPTVTLNAIDLPLPDNSGIDKTYYKIDEYLFQVYTNSFVLTEGNYTVKYYSKDNVGNQEDENTSVIKVDLTAPVTTTNIPVSGWTNNPIVEFYIFDTASGGSTTYYTFATAPTIPPDPTLSSAHGSSFTVQSSGTYNVKYFSIDVAGNVETIKSEVLNLDIEAPYINQFVPLDGIVDESTTQITFHLLDALSGVDISTAIFEVDGIEYSSTKNTSYFNYTGTPADYLVTILPIQGVLNFEDIKLMRVRNVKDLAGNEATPLTFDFSTRDTTPPRIRELNPIPNAQDVSTETNIIAYLTDDQSGVDIRSVVVRINQTDFNIVSRPILRLLWVGDSLSTVRFTIQNNNITTTVDGVRDVSISFADARYDTVKKVNDYLDGLVNYSCSVVDSKYEQYKSIYLLPETNVQINSPVDLDLFIPENNLNFAYIERENGYLVFVTPNFSFEHKVVVSVRISASDNVGNLMSYSYAFIPHKTAWWPVWKRNWLNTDALTYIKDIQTYIPSNYTRSQSTNFYGHHKSIGLELARLTEEINHLFEDLDYTTVRPDYLWQKLGYLLKFKPQAEFSHADYRRILLALIQIFFQGSQKASLESGIALFTQSDVKIIENVFQPGFDISDQFTFSIDVMLGESRLLGLDLQAITNNVNLILDMTRPAHTYYLLRYIWTEKFNFQVGCDPIWLLNQYGQPILDQFGNKIPVLDSSGFQQVVPFSDGAICDVYRMEQEYNETEDVRTDCQGHDEEIIQVEEDVSIQFTGVEDTFETYNKPVLKTPPVPWPNCQLAILPTDIAVTVNGLPVTVSEIDPETGVVKLAITPTAEDVVVVFYHWNPYYVYRHITGYLNNYVVSGNDFDITQGTIFNRFNVNDYLGGFYHGGKKHAHVCETSLEWEIDEHEGETYQFPQCEDGLNERFLLNNYVISGNDFVDGGSYSSYFNNLYDVGFSAACGFVEINIDDLEVEAPIPIPTEDWTDIIVDGRVAGIILPPPLSFFLFGNPDTTGILNDPNYVLIGQEGLTYDRYETRDVVDKLDEIIVDGREIGNLTYEDVKAQIFEAGFILNDSNSLLNDVDDLIVPARFDEYRMEIVDNQTENLNTINDVGTIAEIEVTLSESIIEATETVVGGSIETGIPYTEVIDRATDIASVVADINFILGGDDLSGPPLDNRYFGILNRNVSTLVDTSPVPIPL